MNTLGEKIKELRKKKGMSQSELAEKVGVSRQALSGWENGAYIPDYNSLLLLCKVLETDANTLYGVQPTRTMKDENKVDDTQAVNKVSSKSNKIKQAVKIVSEIIVALLILFIGGVASIPFFDDPNSKKVYSITFAGLSDGDKMKILAVVCLIVEVLLVVKIVKTIINIKRQKKQGDN
ncbi:MAG: helix-turn-helix domain-containing protein [Christensenellales bacterium]